MNQEQKQGTWVINVPEVSPETITIMRDELSKLEQCMVNGWGALYPTLYNTLQGVITSMQKTMGAPATALVLTSIGPNNYQASAHYMTDGSAQLHIGIAFLRKALLDDSTDSFDLRYKRFLWVIAHELAHMCDKNFIAYGKSYQGRRILNFAFYTTWFYSLIGIFFPSQVCHWVVMIGGPYHHFAYMTLILVAMSISRSLFHRRLEYFADAHSVQYVQDITLGDMEHVLQMITDDVKQYLEKTYTMPSQQLTKYWMYFDTFRLHPSIQQSN